jgi:molybdopterin/thiamine biosynthesis adenylyltransferase
VDSPGRYQRHTLIDWFSQADVKNARVCVVGAGAVGNEVLKCLALLGAGTIDVYDFDRIEVHNLTRSVLFRETDIGRNKAECAAARVRELEAERDEARKARTLADALRASAITVEDCRAVETLYAVAGQRGSHRIVQSMRYLGAWLGALPRPGEP